MKDLASVLAPERLRALREAYVPGQMTAANVRAVAAAAPRLGPWNEEVGRTFYDPSGPLAPADRERCLIALTASMGFAIPTAIHMYWGLMEGLSVEEIAQIVGLVGCYAGLPRISFGLEMAHRTLTVLNDTASPLDPASIVTALIAEMAPRLR